MKILDWRNTTARIDAVELILSDGLRDDIKRNEITGCWSDDLSWLPENFDQAWFTEQFTNTFHGIKCFHACSPRSVNSYLRDGFTGGNHEFAIAKFHRLFSDIPLNLRNKAIEEIHSTRESELFKTFFLCDSEPFIERDGHYLIYGSEFIMALAASLCRQQFSEEDFRQRLKGLGIPTIIESDIPFKDLDHHQLNLVISSSLADWGNHQFFPEDFEPKKMSIIAKKELPSTVIINHWHPEKVFDKHGGGIWYYPSNTACSACG